MNVKEFVKTLKEAKPCEVNIGALLWLEVGKYNMNDTIGNITEAKIIEDPLKGPKFIISPRAVNHHFMETLAKILKNNENFSKNLNLSYSLAIEGDNIRIKMYKVNNNKILKGSGTKGCFEYEGKLSEILPEIEPVNPSGNSKGKYFIITVNEITKDNDELNVRLKLFDITEFSDKKELDKLLIQNMLDYDYGGGVLPYTGLQINRKRTVSTSGVVSEPEYTVNNMLVETRQASDQSKESGQMIMNTEFTSGLGKVVFTVEVCNIGFSSYGSTHVLDTEEIKKRTYLAVWTILNTLFNISKSEQKKTITPLIITVTSEPLSNGTLKTTVDPTIYNENANAVIYINRDIEEYISSDKIGKLKKVYENIMNKQGENIKIVNDYNNFMTKALEYVENTYFEDTNTS